MVVLMTVYRKTMALSKLEADEYLGRRTSYHMMIGDGWRLQNWWISKNSQMLFDPPPPFWKILLQFLAVQDSSIGDIVSQ